MTFSRPERPFAALILGTLISLLASASVRAASDPAIAWQHDDAAAFRTAAAERRLVLLYLEAVWCHWCHVMDQRTYADPTVVELIERHYLPLRIDQDARPDLANRYRDYGWPATIVFAADGSEIVKRQGYISPATMRRLLQAIVDDPTPEAAGSTAMDSGPGPSGLAEAVRTELIKRHHDRYDAEHGGLDIAQKYLERDSVEYALVRAADGDDEERRRAIQTLDAALALRDPQWGGFYQYSTGGNWQHPHFEKLTVLQAEYLRLYALAFAQTHDARYLAAATSVRGYLQRFIADPSGAFRVSQDADLRPGEHAADYFALSDTQRSALGVPRVDPSLYTQQTAAVAAAYAVLHEASDDPAALQQAIRGARWVLAERPLAEGGFRHAASDRGGPFLADTLAAGQTFLQLYRVTAERAWFDHAVAAAAFIEQRFRSGAGYVSAQRGAAPIEPLPRIEENIALARFANLLGHYSGQDRHRDMARHARDWLARPEVALSRITEAGILLVDRELETDPLHVTVIGARGDVAAAELHAAAMRLPAAYKRLEWWDPAEGPLPNADVRYPAVQRAAAFVCTERRCSLPIHRAADIAAFVSASAAGTD